MIDASAQVVALAGPGKLGSAAPFVVGSLDDLTHLVADGSAPADVLAAARERDRGGAGLSSPRRAGRPHARLPGDRRRLRHVRRPRPRHQGAPGPERRGARPRAAVHRGRGPGRLPGRRPPDRLDRQPPGRPRRARADAGRPRPGRPGALPAGADGRGPRVRRRQRDPRRGDERPRGDRRARARPSDHVVAARRLEHRRPDRRRGRRAARRRGVDARVNLILVPVAVCALALAGSRALLPAAEDSRRPRCPPCAARRRASRSWG